MERGWRSCVVERNVVTRELHLLARLWAIRRVGEWAKEARSPAPVGRKTRRAERVAVTIMGIRAGFEPCRALTINPERV